MKKLIITLDERTTQEYLKLIRKKTEAEVDAECMPSGASLTIDILPPFGTFVYLENIKIGDAQIDLVED